MPSLALHRAGRWLLDSGIQDPGGGVARYYLAAARRNLPVSTEITGYAASTYAYLFRRTGDARYREAATATAHFLTRTAWDAKLETFPFELAAGSPAYFFDCGIIIRGLLAVWRITGERELLDVAAAAGRAMARDFLTANAIHPVISLPDRAPLAYEKRWSREPGCFQLKAALAWRDLAAATGEPRYREWWQRAFNMACANDARFLPGNDDRHRVMDRLHAYSYYMEALLAERSPAVGPAIARTAGYLREIGPEFARSDVHAQLLRVRLFADALGVAALDAAAAEEEAAAIPLFQYASDDPRLDGGYSFGRKGADLMPFANPVSTGFCLQARDLWELAQAGRFEPDLGALI